jgi:hypothetical protein
MKTLDPTRSKGRSGGRDVRALCGILGFYAVKSYRKDR